MKLKIKFPIIKSYSSKEYPLIIIDTDKKEHYWDFDGGYAGWGKSTHICLN